MNWKKRIYEKEDICSVIDQSSIILRGLVDPIFVADTDLVLLDVIMPGMDGVTVLDSLKKINSDANVIMITADGQEATIKECQDLGAKGYILKPFVKTQVLNEVKKVLR